MRLELMLSEKLRFSWLHSNNNDKQFFRFAFEKIVPMLPSYIFQADYLAVV